MPATRELAAPVPEAARLAGGDLDFGSSAAKAIAVLDSFRGAGAVLGVTEIAARTGLSKSTAHRLLAVLVERRFVQRHDNRYMLGRALFELGALVPDCRPRSLREAAVPLMTDLYASTRATINLAVLEGAEVLYVEKLYGAGSVATPARVGGRMPALCTGVGKALVAFSPPDVIAEHLARPVRRLTPHTVVHRGLLSEQLAKAKETGVAHDHEESQLGIRCIAVPILRPGTSEPMGALSVTMRATENVKSQVVNELRWASNQIAATCRSHGL
ncbi:IclR family transcriptional regulator [Sporichthya polymorpha]|uniref:IclR family transcriptional regulator n=1 Tax=Sporichthya polymorpha TaxID=35751 RepID=UPI000374B130|nr:IclR family transcriptional regulator [Sporichthya polymorpha]